MPAIASLEELKAAQKEGVSISLCSMRFALCFTEMAQDRLEELLLEERTPEQLKGEGD